MMVKLTRLTHKIAIQLHLMAVSCYHLQFPLQAASPETFGYTLVLVHVRSHHIHRRRWWTFRMRNWISHSNYASRTFLGRQ